METGDRAAIQALAELKIKKNEEKIAAAKARKAAETAAGPLALRLALKWEEGGDKTPQSHANSSTNSGKPPKAPEQDKPKPTMPKRDEGSSSGNK
jgi:hypothetical protein